MMFVVIEKYGMFWVLLALRPTGSIDEGLEF
jgi:hypothetical protein